MEFLNDWSLPGNEIFNDALCLISRHTVVKTHKLSKNPVESRNHQARVLKVRVDPIP